MELQQREVIPALEKLAEKLGVKVEMIYGFYVKEAKLYIWRYFIDLFAGLVAMVMGATALYFVRDFWGSGNDLLMVVFVLCCALNTVIAIFVIIHTLSLSKLFSAVTNPEYVATEELLNKLQSTTK